MGLLSEEQQQQMVQQLEGGIAEVQEDEQLEAAESEASAEVEEHEDADEGEVEEALEADSADSVQEEEYDPEEGHRVPYNRFKQINDRRKHLEGEMSSRDQMIEEMKAKLNAKFGQREEPAEESYEEDYGSEDPDDWEVRMSNLQDSNSRLEMKFARMELDKEIRAAQKEYPNVPEDFLWDSIAKDGNATALGAAQQYSAFVAEIEEAAIARHLGQGGEKENASKASAPPRPKSRGASSSSTKDAPPPENMDAARDAMLQYLRS